MKIKDTSFAMNLVLVVMNQDQSLSITAKVVNLDFTLRKAIQKKKMIVIMI